MPCLLWVALCLAAAILIQRASSKRDQVMVLLNSERNKLSSIEQEAMLQTRGGRYSSYHSYNWAYSAVADSVQIGTTVCMWSSFCFINLLGDVSVLLSNCNPLLTCVCTKLCQGIRAVCTKARQYHAPISGTSIEIYGCKVHSRWLLLGLQQFEPSKRLRWREVCTDGKKCSWCANEGSDAYQLHFQIGLVSWNCCVGLWASARDGGNQGRVCNIVSCMQYVRTLLTVDLKAQDCEQSCVEQSSLSFLVDLCCKAKPIVLSLYLYLEDTTAQFMLHAGIDVSTQVPCSWRWHIAGGALTYMYRCFCNSYWESHCISKFQTCGQCKLGSCMGCNKLLRQHQIRQCGLEIARPRQVASACTGSNHYWLVCSWSFDRQAE